MSKKKKVDSFTSIQIIGEKAQALLQRARERMNRNTRAGGKTAALPAKEDIPQLMVNISIISVVKATFAILAIIVGAWLVFAVRDKILVLLLAFFLAIVLDPTVRYLEGWKVPRGIAVLLLYLIVLSLFIFLIASLIPIVALQLQSLARLMLRSVDVFLANPEIAIPFIPQTFNEELTHIAQITLQQLKIEDKASALFQLGEQLSSTATASIAFAGRIAGGIVNFIFNLILVLVLTFFIQIEREKIFEYFRFLFPRRYRSYIDIKTEAIHHKLAQWIRGQLILCISIGLLVFFALWVLDMREYAVTLALLAGFTEFIPVAGPIIAAIPAILIAFTQKGLMWGLVIAGVYYVIQWCENNLLVPLIMKRAVGLSPIAILFAMLVGISFSDTLHPILGIILSVPATTIITLFIRDWQEAKKKE